MKKKIKTVRINGVKHRVRRGKFIRIGIGKERMWKLDMLFEYLGIPF